MGILGDGTNNLLSSRFSEILFDESKIKSKAVPTLKLVGIKFFLPNYSYSILGPRLDRLKPALQIPLKFS